MMNFSAIEWARGRSRTESVRGRPSEEHSNTVPDATQLHTLYLGPVYRYVARRLERREDAEDVCAEVFAVAFEQLPSFRGEVEVQLWLLGIARRKVADAVRKKVRRRETAILDSQDHERPDTNRLSLPQQAVIHAEGRAVMQSILSGLKDQQREVLLLKYVEELSVEEIAVVINRSKAATNSLLQRARTAAFKAGESYFLDFRSTTPNTQRGEK